MQSLRTIQHSSQRRTLSGNGGKALRNRGAADKDCCTIAEFGVRMAWINEAKNSGNMEALAGVPDACTTVEKVLVVTETVETGVEDTASKELSKLFRGDMTADANPKDWKKHGTITPEWITGVRQKEQSYAEQDYTALTQPRTPAKMIHCRCVV